MPAMPFIERTFHRTQFVVELHIKNLSNTQIIENFAVEMTYGLF